MNKLDHLTTTLIAGSIPLLLFALLAYAFGPLSGLFFLVMGVVMLLLATICFIISVSSNLWSKL